MSNLTLPNNILNVNYNNNEFILAIVVMIWSRVYILKCNFLNFFRHYRIRLIENEWKLKH